VTDDEILDAILAREGGFVDDPADRGGATNYGITQGTLSEVLDKVASRDDVKALTPQLAREIYRRRYIEGPGFDGIASGDLRAVVVDAAVNHGVKTAIKLLQRVLKVTDDGLLGPVSFTAANVLDGRLLARKVLWERIRLYGRLISHNLTDADRDGIPDNTEFASGWLNRTADQGEALA
jgi:lysozyme family protein